jgi:hypothetical protein
VSSKTTPLVRRTSTECGRDDVGVWGWDRCLHDRGDRRQQVDLYTAIHRAVLTGIVENERPEQISARASEVDRLGTPHTGDIKVSPPTPEACSAAGLT